MNNLLSFTGVLNGILYIFIAILVLLLMVLIHELGHYTAGKILGFKINEFAIGFGKPIFSKTKKNGEVVSLRWFPLGGFCAFEGENEDSDNKDAFNNQKPWKRLIVLFAGVFFNFLSAVIFSLILLVSYGYDIPQISEVVANAGNDNVSILQQGDVIYEVNGTKIDFVYDNSLNTLIAEYTSTSEFENMEEKTIELGIKRDGEKQVVDAKLIEYEVDGNIEYKLFIQVKGYVYTFGEALGECWTFTFRWAWKVLIIFGQLITGQIPLTQIGGPVTTVTMIANYTQQNFANFVLLLPLIAINLAVFNLLPIPALDGAHMLFVFIEWIRKKPINRQLENKIHTIGLYVLFGFVILVDIIHFLG